MATDAAGASAEQVFAVQVTPPGIQGTAGADTLTGTALNDNLYGLAGNDTLIGLAGNDMLDGGAGADTMRGGAGNDTYYVDDAGDVVDEQVATTTTTDQGYMAGDAEYGYYWVPNWVTTTTYSDAAGTDTVYASVSRTLGVYQENLTLTGSASVNATGNTLNNTISGNAGNNVLTGGAGNDTYLSGTGSGSDTIVESDGTTGTDVLKFLSGVSTDQLWFRQSGANLEVSIIGTNDKATVQNWYSGAAYHVEQFKTVDGNKTLLDSQVQNLVSAMAAFTPPAAGQTTLPSNYATALAPVIAANWQ